MPIKAYGYLLNHLCGSMSSEGPDESVNYYITETNKALNISIWICSVHDARIRSKSMASHRLLFMLPNGERNDLYASDIAEGVLLLAELFHGPLLELPYHTVVFPFEMKRPYQNLQIRTLEKLIATELNEESRMFLFHEISSYYGIPDNIVALAIKALPIILHHRHIFLALGFLSHAQRDFYVYPGQLNEAIYEGDWTPTRISEMASWESAFQNSYKAIEAIIGDPSKNDRKYRDNLLREGLNPSERVGFRKKECISDVIRRMNRVRDSSVAHGSTPNRGIQMIQMVEFQECARYVIEATLEHKYGKKLFTEDLGFINWETVK